MIGEHLARDDFRGVGRREWAALEADRKHCGRQCSDGRQRDQPADSLRAAAGPQINEGRAGLASADAPFSLDDPVQLTFFS